VNLLIDATAAQTEADRITALYSEEQKFYKVPIALDSVDFSTIVDGIGNTYTIKSDQIGLESGADFVLVGVDGNFLENELMLTLWGRG